MALAHPKAIIDGRKCWLVIGVIPGRRRNIIRLVNAIGALVLVAKIVLGIAVVHGSRRRRALVLRGWVRMDRVRGRVLVNWACSVKHWCWGRHSCLDRKRKVCLNRCSNWCWNWSGIALAKSLPNLDLRSRGKRRDVPNLIQTSV